jgi:hypothetical protein
VFSVARRFLGNRLPANEDQVRMAGIELYFRSDKAVRELSLPRTPFRTAVERSYAWFREHGYLD